MLIEKSRLSSIPPRYSMSFLLFQLCYKGSNSKNLFKGDDVGNAQSPKLTSNEAHVRNAGQNN